MNEFTELKLAPQFPRGSILAAYLVQALLVGLQFVCGPSSVLGILIAGWSISISFPSLWKIVPLWREIRARRAGWEPEPDAAPASRPAPTDTRQVEFVSQLMDMGARELATIHHVHAESRSLPQLESLLRSRLLSAALALSIVIPLLGLLWPGMTRSSVDDFLAGPSLLFVLIFLVYPPWLWAACRLEYKLRLARLRLVQHERDRIAGEVSTLLSAEDFQARELPTDFGLYLRAFMTTDKLHIRGFDLETMLAYSIGPTLPLLALGKPGEHLGAGRVQTSDEGWQEEILRLMRAARLILIIPSHRAGTLWEIATLRQGGFLEKTIFIMPPELPFHGGQFSQDWAQTVAAAQTVGVEFPQHLSAGALFRLGADGSFADYAPFLSEEFLQEFEPDIGRGWSGDYSSDASLGADTASTTHAADTANADSGLGADGIDAGGGFIHAGYGGHAGPDGGGDVGGHVGGDGGGSHGGHSGG